MNQIDMDAVVWLTYDDIAERLGIERESARTLVKRKRWGRRPGNDGRVRIRVPEEVLGSKAIKDPDPGQEPVHPTGSSLVHEPGVAEILGRHIERLEHQLETALNRVSDRDAIASERDILSAQVDALRAALVAAETDRNRWHDVATRISEPISRQSWWRRLTA